jgi:hypothetical protein
MRAAQQIPYSELALLADRLFLESSDDEERLASVLDRVNPGVRSQLLVSDLLNAYQAFFYFFRERPNQEIEERLMLESASALVRGVFVEEVDLYGIYLRVDGEDPVVEVSDGKQVLSVFRGKNAYREALQFAGEPR